MGKLVRVKIGSPDLNNFVTINTDQIVKIEKGNMNPKITMVTMSSGPGLIVPMPEEEFLKLIS